MEFSEAIEERRHSLCALSRRYWLRYTFALASIAALLTVRRGVPFSWQLSTIWAVALLLLLRPRLRMQRVLLDWLPLLAIIVAYEWTRGLVYELHRPVNYSFAISADRFLFGAVPVIPLQRALLNPQRIAPWEVLPSLLYASHFIAPLAVGAWLYARDRATWLRYRAAVTLTFAIALVGYVVFPMAPPWMASEMGLIEPIMRSSARGWSYIGFPIARDLSDYGVRYGNPVAAMPSVHAALPMVYALILWRRSGWIARALLIAYTFAMALALVLGGEHYAIDVLAGWFTAGVATCAADRVVRKQGMGAVAQALAFRRGSGSKKVVRSESSASKDSNV